MSEQNQIIAVCREFAKQLSGCFEREMNKSYDEVYKKDPNSKEFLDFFNKYHKSAKNDKRPKYEGLIEKDLEWFNDTYKLFNGKTISETSLFKYLDEEVFGEDDELFGGGLFD